MVARRERMKNADILPFNRPIDADSKGMSIHAHPELGFEEEKSCGWVCESLTDAGFAVNKGICDLPTAFTAQFGSGPLNIGICAEYDCLPGIGHACGHNIIAASAVGAALAVAEVADEIGLTVNAEPSVVSMPP